MTAATKEHPAGPRPRASEMPMPRRLLKPAPPKADREPPKERTFGRRPKLIVFPAGQRPIVVRCSPWCLRCERLSRHAGNCPGLAGGDSDIEPLCWIDAATGRERFPIAWSAA